jgi:hypothetical protein
MLNVVVGFYEGFALETLNVVVGFCEGFALGLLTAVDRPLPPLLVHDLADKR